MERMLCLMRHGLSFERERDKTDLERPIDPKGIPAIIAAGQKVQAILGIPQVIICSKAERAKQTALYLAESINYSTDQIHVNDELYEASARIFFQIVTQLKNEWDKILIIAHNPAITYIAEYLSSAEIGNLREANSVVIKFETDKWENVTQGSGKLIHNISI